MFLRFSKGQYDANNIRKYKKCVFLNDTLIMEYGDKIVGIAKLHEETDKVRDYDVIVANKCELGGDKIAQYIKNMISKSNKFSEKPTLKRRKYFVEYIDKDTLPIKAKVTFVRE